MLRSIGAGALLLGLLAPLMACGDEPTALGEVLFEYALTAINGEAPPRVIFENETGRLLMNEGQMALSDTDRYVQQINFTQILSDTEVRTSRICEGTYTLAGTSLVLEEEECDGQVYQATLVNDTITYTFSQGVELTWVLLAEPAQGSIMTTPATP